MFTCTCSQPDGEGQHLVNCDLYLDPVNDPHTLACIHRFARDSDDPATVYRIASFGAMFGGNHASDASIDAPLYLEQWAHEVGEAPGKVGAS